MENFKKFVDTVVSKWRNEKPSIIAQLGLALPGNRIMGDWAEKGVVRRIQTLKPKYEVFLSKGSQTPADVYAVCKRQSFYHIMLLQVKSSATFEDVICLNDTDLKVYYELGKMVKKEFKKQYPELKEKPLLISMGYIAVFNEVKKGKVIPVIFRSYVYKNFVSNFGNIDTTKAKELVSKTQFAIYK
jgi:hypothetical protein